MHKPHSLALDIRQIKPPIRRKHMPIVVHTCTSLPKRLKKHRNPIIEIRIPARIIKLGPLLVSPTLIDNHAFEPHRITRQIRSHQHERQEDVANRQPKKPVCQAEQLPRTIPLDYGIHVADTTHERGARQSLARQEARTCERVGRAAARADDAEARRVQMVCEREHVGGPVDEATGRERREAASGPVDGD
ncbi:hypothetical protein SLS59_005544 [Nothophoma quercina]|uniref:Uncharacterized protein n=1 Tax=Nothophoma quercina TaxID=749835 RepID=A0ABR3R8X5_9PLEO